MKGRYSSVFNNLYTAFLRNRYTALLLLLSSALFYSCAQVVAPTGGKIDKTPPKTIKYTPDSAALNFNSKKITVVFDELIQLRDLNNQLIVSPPLEFMPDVQAKNESLLFEFDKKEILKPNTTYSVNFGNSIQDIHESNALDNFKYVFSTGSSIDSLSVKGKVETAFEHKPEKGTLVMLYSNYNDSSIYKTLPDYFTKTKEDGTFQINHIRAGKYKMMALKDGNANMKYDNENESIGFKDTLIDVTGKQTIAISLFQQPAKKLFLKSTIRTYGNITLIFNKPAGEIAINPLNHAFAKEDVFLSYSKNTDTVNYWFKEVEKDSIALQILNDNSIVDTLTFKVIKKADALKSNRNPLKFKLVSSPGQNQNFELNAGMVFVFNNPIEPGTIEELKKKEIKLIEDSIPYQGTTTDLFFQQKTLSSFIIKTRSDKAQINGSPVLKENTKYHLFIPPGTFTDIFGLTNDTIKIDFKTREEKQYGTLKLKLDIPETQGNYIVQLLDEKENVVRESIVKKSETIFHQHLIAKKYKLKIIVDENANNKWDTGSLDNKQQPEKVIYNVELITTRPNWDSELEWKVIP